LKKHRGLKKKERWARKEILADNGKLDPLQKGRYNSALKERLARGKEKTIQIRDTGGGGAGRR